MEMEKVRRDVRCYDDSCFGDRDLFAIYCSGHLVKELLELAGENIGPALVPAASVGRFAGP